MKIPKSVWLLAQHFHPDSLDGDRTVEHVLYEYVKKQGIKKLQEAQQFMSDSLAVNDEITIQDQWEKAGSGIDFEDYTSEFFRIVVGFDPTPDSL